MLSSLRLTNFRRFEDHEVPLKSRTVIVGPNNAGKSTIVEAIRLVSLVANRYRSLQYVRVPSWLNDPVGMRGVSPSLRDLNTNLRMVFHSFSSPPAIVEGRFKNGTTISIYIGPDENIFAVIHDVEGHVITSKADANRLNLSRVAIQPQVAPLAPSERRLDPETVRRGLDSPLAPAHFRNQLLLADSSLSRRFTHLAETTWPGLQVKELVGGTAAEDDILALLVRDGSFVGEVATMGHGLQMWLQVVWFLARNEKSPTIVLDEPDVYLHADLQRKLMRLLQTSHQQVIVATHSVEIMAEVEPSDILTVNGQVRKSKWANNLRGVQRIIDNIGGVHNLQFARLANARRCLFVEGNDVDILKRIYDLLMPTVDPLDILPRLSVGGWDGWQKVVGTAQFLRNSTEGVIKAYSLFDSDYHEPQDILDRYEEASRLSIRLHVWERKEIENYLLDPACLQRVIASRVRSSIVAPSTEEVEAKLIEIAEGLIDDSADDCTASYFQRHRRLGVATATRWARAYVRERRSELGGLLSVVPGKTVVRQLSEWTNESFGITFGPATLARELRVNEVSPEMHDVLKAIQSGTSFPTNYLATWTGRLS